MALHPADDRLAHAAAVAGPLTPTTAMVAVDNRLPTGTGRALVDVDGALDAEFSAYRGHLVLLRPDRFVAAAWPPGAPPHLITELATTAPALSGA